MTALDDLTLLAVFDDEQRIERTATALHDKGIEVVVNDPSDYVRSLRAEMGAEAEHAAMVPPAGVAEEGSPRLVGLGMLVGALLGAAAAAPLTLALFDDLATLPRLGMAVVIGGFGGSAMGFVVGLALSAAPRRAPAAQRGLTLRVSANEPGIEQVLADAQPIRVDLLDRSGARVDTVMSEELPAFDLQERAASLFDPSGGAKPMPGAPLEVPPTQDAERGGDG